MSQSINCLTIKMRFSFYIGSLTAKQGEEDLFRHLVTGQKLKLYTQPKAGNVLRVQMVKNFINNKRQENSNKTNENIEMKERKKAIIHLYLKTFTVILNLQTFHTLEF